MNSRLIDTLNTLDHTNIVRATYDAALGMWCAETTWGECRVWGERGAICVQRREKRQRKWSTCYILSEDPIPAHVVASLYLDN